MRQIVLDTETTGLEYKLGHRIVEIAAVEISNRQLTGNHFHRYLNPERESDEGALQVHGLTRAFLQDKPKFREIARDFLDFVYEAELIIHNAPFDVGFLNHELGLEKMSTLDTYCAQITDTLKLAKDLHPGKRNNLDALCERYKIDNSKRTLHGALLDAELLAEVYLAMTRGQESLMMDLDSTNPIGSQIDYGVDSLSLRVISASAEELERHECQLEQIDRESDNRCIWKKMEC
ncbi:MAG: DNA polymerase III subunit epsilon [Burkholderiales bacterium]|uniref:DNA polymerase III subunit epsilon n=1 Tax=Nitrosomonas sp. TaxID=42353 RepID=UPI001D6B0B12|nr:DNA polymerase III subunit epsilon [Nitrosomonas sp.]MCB1949001.1 DNA polymerase III subunit epsilon [Nitrosomonas sp.]MCP5243343.1 DNA polymerase III subunit epsilon [Burkholderiales bacterium]MCP5292854.1 DNA polymerase III subunit epsilon [Burkholderiales bacterium]